MNYIEDIQKSCSIKEGTGVIEGTEKGILLRFNPNL